MKISSFPAALVAISTLLFCQPAKADDLKDMAGSWKVETAEAGGQKIDSDDLKSIVVKVTGDVFEVKTKDGTMTGTLKLDATQKPKTLDATHKDGDDAGKVVKAIYELTGDSMKICYATDGGERPKDFTTSASGQMLLTYKREKK